MFLPAGQERPSHPLHLPGVVFESSEQLDQGVGGVVDDPAEGFLLDLLAGQGAFRREDWFARPDVLEQFDGNREPPVIGRFDQQRRDVGLQEVFAKTGSLGVDNLTDRKSVV